MGKSIIIIPTYNEAETIGSLLNIVLKVSPESDILIIDDKSIDGTIDIVKNFMRNHSSIKMIVREDERGLGTALKRGYKEAYHGGYEIIVQMDADLQHPPEKISELIKTIEEGYDVAVASRYVSGGGIVGWTFYRRFISKVANNYARYLLGLKVKDVTTGFRAFSRRAIEYILNKNLSSKGYVIQVETLYILENAGFKIRECPFIFKNRYAGKSKLRLKIIVEFFFRIPYIKIRRH